MYMGEEKAVYHTYVNEQPPTEEPSYLENIGSGDEAKIIEKSFPEGLSNFLETVENSLIDLFQEKSETYLEPVWQKCKNSEKIKCKTILEDYITKEMNSTAYMLRCLQKSMIGGKVNIVCNDLEKINGIWDHDKEYFTITNFTGQRTGKLIMGFGPSASGKTYWAKNIIKMMKQLDPNFPSEFICIDGGIYRKSSVIYQLIVHHVMEKHIGGLINLVSASGGSSLFSAGIIKKAISKFLAGLPQRSNLYVPETLGSCRGGYNFSKGTRCSKSYDKYQLITKDRNWVGLCIWQHVEDTKCVFSPKYKCLGCKESGMARERREGKQYSSSNWEPSFYHGIKNAKKASKWFIIHNTGGRKYKKADGTESPCINLIETSVTIKQPTKNAIERDFNCKFIPEMNKNTRV